MTYIGCISTIFNSRPHAEVDFTSSHAFFMISDFSTHDLTQRSTFPTPYPISRPTVFQLTTSRRGRLDKLYTVVMWVLSFQLTTSRRGRLLSCSIPQSRNLFNSRPHAEVDRSGCVIQQCRCNFQLTTSRRGRRPFIIILKNAPLSTHDLTQRSTLCSVSMIKNWNLSTHDLTQRSTKPV